MPVKLTPELLRTLRPRPEMRRFIVWDTLSPLGVRVSATETGTPTLTWVTRVRVRGTHGGPADAPTAGYLRRLITIGDYPSTTLAAARKAARAHKRQADAGEDVIAQRRAEEQAERERQLAERRQKTVKALADLYLAEYAKPRKTAGGYANDAQILRQILDGRPDADPPVPPLAPTWAAMKAADLTRQDVRDLVKPLAEKAPYHANRCLATLRKLFNWALSEDLLAGANPCANLKRPGVETPRDRVLTDGEITALWTVGLADEPLPMQGLIKLLLLTGQRVTEVAEMTWDEVDLDAGVWQIARARTKARRPQLVPLAPAAVTVLRELPREHPTFVFAGRPRNGRRVAVAYPATTWDRIRNRVRSAVKGDPETYDLRPHDLRRSVATRAAALGTPAHVLERLLNHAPVGVTARHYDQHAYLGEKRLALERWADVLLGIVEGKPASTVVTFTPRGGVR